MMTYPLGLSATLPGRPVVPLRLTRLDVTCCEARVNHRAVVQAVMIAIAIRADGQRKVFGLDSIFRNGRTVISTEDSLALTDFKSRTGRESSRPTC